MTAKGTTMAELVVDFITSLDGFGAAEGWPGFWGLNVPEYIAWLDEVPDRHHTILMGANTYRLMAGFAAGSVETGQAEEDAMAELSAASKIVFSSTLELPLAWSNTRLVRNDPVAEVRAMKEAGASMRTLGSLTLWSTASAWSSSRSSPERPAWTASTTVGPTSPWT
jgi:dihydrofolate reductase